MPSVDIISARGGARPVDIVDLLRDETFTRLRPYFPAESLEGAMHCAAKIYIALPDKRDLSRNVVLVACGGGKDSCYMLAFVRAIQLLLFRVYGGTFRMRVVTNRHAGMPRAVMENLRRCYQALKLFEDPDCELLLIDGNLVRGFQVDAPQPEELVLRNREDILMTGHRTMADARPTFCNACNLSMLNAFGLAASYGDGADLIITGDSPREQRAYLVWAHRLARQFRLESVESGDRGGFRGFLGMMNNIAQVYFHEIHGGDAVEAVRQRRVELRVPGALRFFSIYDHTAYASGEHWELLTRFLGFQFDDLAFSFTESDCAHPGLMGHLRGIKCERLFGRSYVEGVAEYVRFATSLMHEKQFPPVLIQMMQARYIDGESIGRMRRVMDSFAAEALGLHEAQLVCMVYAPFADAGRNLALYLQREQPALVGSIAAIHSLLRGGGAPAPGTEAAELRTALEQQSGLCLAQMRILYARPLGTTPVESEEPSMLSVILERDPHKSVIETRHAPAGPLVRETLSGR